MIQRIFTFYKDSFGGLSRPVWLLSLVTLINRAGAMVIPFMTIYLTSELGFTMAQSGYVMACFGLGSVVGSYFGGQLTDRIGYHSTMIGSLFLGGWMFIALMWMKTFFAVCLTIFVLSLIVDSFRPAIFAAVAVFSKKENRTRSVSLIRLAINLGFSIGPAIGGFLAATAGYNWLFILDGVTCMVAAGVIILRLPAHQEEVLTEEEIENPAAPISILNDKIYLVFIFLNLIVGIIFMQFFFTIPVFFKEELLLSEFVIGTILALNGLILALTEMPFVFFLENKKPPMYYIAIGAFLIGMTYFVFLPFSGGVLIAIISVLFFTVGEMFKIPFANAFALNRATPQNRGTYMGYYVMTFSVACVVAPILGLQTVEHFGYGILWWMLGIAGVVATFGYLKLQRMIEQETQTMEEGALGVVVNDYL